MKKIIMLLLIVSLVIGTSCFVYADVTANSAEKDKTVLTTDFVSIATEFINRRTSALIESETVINKATLESGSVYESTDLYKSEQVTLSELDQRRTVLQDFGEAYTNSDTELTLENITINDKTAILEVKELTKLYYKKIHGNEPEYTAWSDSRRFVFQKNESGWELIEQKLLNDNGPAPIIDSTGVTENEMRNAISKFSELTIENGSKRDKETSEIGIMSTYNPSAASAYAKQYWYNYNLSYRSFSLDCTNFVSQAMRAGGWTDISGLYTNSHYWWYNSSNQTYSWTGVRYWYEFAYLYSGRTYILNNPQSMLVGDVLQADFTSDNSKDHSMIVTYKSSNVPYLTYHTNDTYERSFSSLVSSYPNATWYPHALYYSF